MTAPVQVQPNLSKQFITEVDDSGVGQYCRNALDQTISCILVLSFRTADAPRSGIIMWAIMNY